MGCVSSCATTGPPCGCVRGRGATAPRSSPSSRSSRARSAATACWSTASSSAWQPTAAPTFPVSEGGSAPRPRRPAAMPRARRSRTWLSTCSISMAARPASFPTSAVASCCSGSSSTTGGAGGRRGTSSASPSRCGAWVKHKHRRVESFLVTGWTPPERRRPESLLLARVGSDGTLEPAGSVPLVPANGQADDARRRLEPLVLPPTRRGQRIRRLGPGLRADVAFHGPPRGPLRDPILRAVAMLDQPHRS
jgi:hypothetical protein